MRRLLWDRLFRSDFSYQGPTALERPFAEEPEGVFVIDNVAQYVMETVGMHEPEFDYRSPDYPCSIPPYQYTWMEYAVPSRFREDGKLREGWGSSDWLAGVGMTTLDLHKGGKQTPVEFCMRLMHAAQKNSTTPLGDDQAERFSRDIAAHNPRWVVSSVCYAYTQAYGRFLFSGNVKSLHILNDDGVLLTLPMVQIAGMDLYKAVLDMDHQQIVEIQRQLMAPAMYALAMLHISNVQQVDHTPDPLPRAARRRGEQMGLSYKTLTIRPMSAKAKALAVQQGNKDVLLRWHLVRGHRADYRENGLFGKYHGIYWVPGHARGDKNQGQVLKDYEVVTG